MSRAFEPRLPIPLEELLAHADWLRRLAGNLVADPARADDLVQDTWLAALRHPPLAGASPRPWLERVFRNLARNRRRSEGTRERHEAHANEPRSSPSPEAIAAEVEAQRLLAEAVGRLADPARTIVVLRYFRGLDASAIGRELGLPPGTVRWRLAAALEELRRELDRRFEGGRKAWCLALGRVLASAARPAATVSVGWIGAAALVLVCAGWWSASGGAPREDPAVAAVDVARLEPAPAAALLAPLDAGDTDVVAEPRPKAPRVPLDVNTESRSTARALPDIRGSVLVDGAAPARPVDLDLIVFGTDRKLDTDDAGRFEVFALGDCARFTLRAPGYLLEDDESSIWLPPSLVTPALDLVVRLRTPPAIRGRVVTRDGAPVPNAHGFYELRAEASGWHLSSERREVQCDAQGRFELTLLGLMCEGMPKLRADETWEGVLLFEVARVGRGLFDLLPGPARDLELGDLVLEPVRGLAFTVRDERGAPLSGAVARLDDSWITAPSSPTNREGLGELRHAPDRAVRVRFSALGYFDRVLALEPGDQPVAWLEPCTLLEVQLEPPANTYGPFPDLVLAARGELFEPVDAPLPEFTFDRDPIQTELGATPNHDHGSTKDASGPCSHARWKADAGGRVLIAGLRPDVAFTLEARDEAGRVMARRELVLGAGERKRLALPYGE